MAELLVYARDSGPDVTQQYQRGDIVEVRASGAPRGRLEGPPDFVWIECPEVSREQIIDRMAEWLILIDYSVLARDVAQDGWRLAAFNTAPAVGGLGQLTRAQVETFLNNWGATVVSVAPNEVTFDWRILDGASSPEFWHANVSLIAFSEISYDEGTGVHRIEADYAAAGFPAATVARAVQRRGGTLVQNNANRIRFDIDREVVRNSFLNDVRSKARGLLRRRRFRVLESVVDTAFTAGSIQVTAAELEVIVRDRRAE